MSLSRVEKLSLARVREYATLVLDYCEDDEILSTFLETFRALSKVPSPWTSLDQLLVYLLY
jgi:hypothetical protein